LSSADGIKKVRNRNAVVRSSLLQIKGNRAVSE